MRVVSVFLYVFFFILGGIATYTCIFWLPLARSPTKLIVSVMSGLACNADVTLTSDNAALFLMMFVLHAVLLLAILFAIGVLILFVYRIRKAFPGEPQYAPSEGDKMKNTDGMPLTIHIKQISPDCFQAYLEGVNEPKEGRSAAEAMGELVANNQKILNLRVTASVQSFRRGLDGDISTESASIKKIE